MHKFVSRFFFTRGCRTVLVVFSPAEFLTFFQYFQYFAVEIVAYLYLRFLEYHIIGIPEHHTYHLSIYVYQFILYSFWVYYDLLNIVAQLFYHFHIVASIIQHIIQCPNDKLLILF